MISTKETTYSKDTANKKLNVVREFDAPVDKVWRAWTESSLLDQWWAPRPWMAVTQNMDFKPGGRWFYYMQGPDGTRHYSTVDYKSIDPGKSFTGVDAFSDEKGEMLKEMPSMQWTVKFKPAGDATRVEIEITFGSLEDMEKIIEMGFKEGFAAGHNQLDELLRKQ